MWSRRGLTLLGKVTIIKTLIIPTLLFKLSVLPVDVPNAFTTSLNRSLFTFLWGSKWEKVSRKVLISPVAEGGINMMDITSYIAAQKLKWLYELFNPASQSTWKAIETLIPESYLWEAIKSNLPNNHALIKTVIPYRTLRSSLSAARLVIEPTSHKDNEQRKLPLVKQKCEI